MMDDTYGRLLVRSRALGIQTTDHLSMGGIAQVGRQRLFGDRLLK